jgi:hypothetical protein
VSPRALFIVLAAGLSAAFAQPLQIASDQLSQLRYRYIGPVGNRVIASASIPGDPNIYYVGAASGGIFKSTDGGVHWDPIFDGQPVSSIGSLALAPSDPNVVWAGTGETFIRSHISVGAGIYKSLDAGKTWSLTRATPRSSSPVRSAMLTGRSRSAASTAPPTAAKPGSRCWQ